MTILKDNRENNIIRNIEDSKKKLILNIKTNQL